MYSTHVPPHREPGGHNPEGLKGTGEADLIAAEDTRRTQQLLNHYRIKTPMTSYHAHNRRKKGEYLLKLLDQGKKLRW